MIIKHVKKTAILSAVLIVISLGFMFINMFKSGFGTLGLNLGIDFAGGTVMQLNLGEEFDMEEVRDILGGFGLEGSTLQALRVEDESGVLKDEGILIKTPIIEDTVRDEILAAFLERWPGMDPEDRRIESVGGAVGEEQKRMSWIALAVALAGMVIYITFRFEYRFALTTIAAILHDVIIVLGFFAITRMEINLPFIAALLTIVGYSINDTIVIIDRIRENMKYKKRKETLAEIVDRSIVQSLSRSINTSATTLMVLIALMAGFHIFIGSLDLIVFVVAMIIGVITGTYSSIFVVSPLWLLWKEQELARAKAH